MKNTVDFKELNRAAIPYLPAILARVAPGGKTIGREYTVCNPRRNDRRPGSFKINVRSGKWADFMTGDAGGDVISLLAYLMGVSQVEAARTLDGMIGFTNAEERHHA